ncbi:acetate/propionate family kinase [Oligosphaera ethanolica]|uniref:Acetate kinase n=1 Tax=Oligosphaera ethanolica TaxID=760260 RepID=A0AAE3VG50_9BACT|nr:acetate kinase [Oligosphaera ethanolica]MDQ0289656.1 acetate kinase [Oligosphaera ethanolica]
MKVLVVNSGSSSLKFTLFSMTNKTVLAKGLVERIGMSNPKLTYQATDKNKLEEVLSITNHSEALQAVCDKLVDPSYGVLEKLSEVQAIGHRVLHGGKTYTSPILVNEDVKEGIRKCIVLGPLHNPANLGGIEACEQVFPGTPNVAVFDTAFHQTMEPEAYMYAIPREFYDKYDVRKYGFHGTSHKFVYFNSCEFLGLDPDKAKIITCHLGNGSSLAAVKGGKVLDTSMGLTPLMGLVMGTRCGDLDPAAVFFLMKQTGATPDEMDSILNKKSGLLGVSGVSSDMRDIENAMALGNKHAREAYNIFLHRLIHYIGGYFLILGGADAIVFTGGIGENGIPTRKKIVDQLNAIGCYLDSDANQRRGEQVVISTPESKVKVLVTPTNEELMIAMETVSLMK